MNATSRQSRHILNAAEYASTGYRPSTAPTESRYQPISGWPSAAPANGKIFKVPVAVPDICIGKESLLFYIFKISPFGRNDRRNVVSVYCVIWDNG